jgi:hypothetical protein
MYPYSKNLGVNFLRSWEFEFKFKRVPKQWSFKKIYELYLCAKERSDKRRKEHSNFINKIIKEVQPNEHGQHRVYFSREHDKTYMYCIRKDNDFGWCYSTEQVKFSKDIVIGRDEKLEFILSNQKQFELGEELRRLDLMKSNFDRHIFSIIEQLVNESLCKKYKNVKNYEVPKVLKVNIGGTIYYAALDKESRNSGYDWKKFEILGIENPEIINLD